MLLPHVRYIECEPDVTRVRALPEDRFIVMASDGLWDVMEDRESVAIVQVKNLPIGVSPIPSKWGP